MEEPKNKPKKVKFWAGKIESTADYSGWTNEQINQEFIEWLVQVADAGWKVIEEGEDSDDD